MTEEDFRGLEDPARAAHFTEKEKAALAIATKLTTPPTDSAEAEIAAAKSFFNDVEIIDIVATVALANLTNRLTDGLQLELDAPAS